MIADVDAPLGALSSKSCPAPLDHRVDDNYVHAAALFAVWCFVESPSKSTRRLSMDSGLEMMEMDD